MTLSVRRYAMLGALLALVLGSFVLQASPAHADRCNPEELLGYEPITPEDQGPICDILINQVYPAVCPGTTTLASCTANVDLAGTGDAANVCVVFDLLGCRTWVGTGGVGTGEPGSGTPAFGPVDVAGTTQQYAVCVTKDFAGGQICVGGRRLVDG